LSESMPTSVPEDSLAIVFADISGSTSLYELLGDAAARHRIAVCLEQLTGVVIAHRGRVVKTNGDDMLCVFDDTISATLAACAMQESLIQGSEATEPVLVALSVRIGMHVGPAIQEKGDVFGDVVNLASRMVGQAKTGQIITTRLFVEQLPPMLQSATRLIDHTEVRGKKDAIDLFEVLWQHEETTLMSMDLQVRPASGAQLLVRCGERSLVMGRGLRHLVLGRSTSAELHVNEVLASRLHARLEYRRGKFFLIDQSTNGTYVRKGEEKIFVRREEIVLTGSGEMSLGRPFSEETGRALVYFQAIEPPAEGEVTE